MALIIKSEINQAFAIRNPLQASAAKQEAINRKRLPPLSSSRKSSFTAAIYRHLERRARDGRSDPR